VNQRRSGRRASQDASCHLVAAFYPCQVKPCGGGRVTGADPVPGHRRNGEASALLHYVGRRTQFFCRVTGPAMTSPSCYRVKRLLENRIDTFTAGLQAAPVSSCCAGERVVRTMHVAAGCRQQTSACRRALRCRHNATIRWPDRPHCFARRCRSGHRRVA